MRAHIGSRVGAAESICMVENWRVESKNKLKILFGRITQCMHVCAPVSWRDVDVKVAADLESAAGANETVSLGFFKTEWSRYMAKKESLYMFQVKTDIK